MSHSANDELRENQHNDAPPTMFHVYVYAEGISINGKEYLLDDAGERMLFPSDENARRFITDAVIQVGDLEQGSNTMTDDELEKMGYYIGLDLQEWSVTG
tara:strand:+ start:38 stop:337 length:300 start_codon:yes stop_codon:yes gene_type:complete